MWLVFDSTKPLDVEPIRAKGGALIGDVNRLDLPQGQAIRLRLNRPQIPSLTGSDAGNEWTVTFADTMQAPPQPLMAIRNITDPALANVTVPLAKPGLMHRFTDPDAGDNLMVVTAPLPVRGFIKRQDFVELSLLESIHGVAVHPNSDDVKAEIATDKILLGRPGGLTLSSADVAAERANLAVRPIFDIGEWREHQAGNFLAREDALIKAMGAAAPDVRPQARLDLARFYMARGLYPEAKGVADLVLSEVKPGFEESAALMLRAVANILIGRPEQALKDFANPVIGTNYDTQLWRALAAARLEQMGGGARKIQECRVRDRIPAGRAAAHRADRSDARLAGGKGLFRRGAAAQRSRCRHRHARDEAVDRDPARPARRGARPRPRCAERLPDRDAFAGPRGGVGRQAARPHPAAEARGDCASRSAARSRNAVDDLAPRRGRGEGAADDGAHLCRHRPLQ